MAIFVAVLIIDYLFNNFSKVILHNVHSLSCVVSKVLLDKLDVWLMIEQGFPKMPATSKFTCILHWVPCV